jgi:hypothetical protein
LNKDNLLYATIGVLLGFISGYLLHEVMVARQPPRRLAGAGPAMVGEPATGIGAQVGPETAPAAAGDAASAGGDPGGGGGAASPAAAMQNIQRLRDYVASHPKDADAVLQLANLNYDIRNWERARDLYHQYLGLRPGNPDVLVDLGISYRGLKNYDQAIDLFHQAEKAAPANWQARFNEVVVLAFDLKHYDAAAPVLAELQKQQPGNPEVAQLAAEFNRRRSAS